MNDVVIAPSLVQLSIALVPVALTLVIMWRWSMDVGNALYALGRMLIQLLLIGYVLAWIFGAKTGWLILLVLLIMAVTSSWIALRTAPGERLPLFGAAFTGIFLGGGFVLALITFAVLELSPWYLPNYMIPLAGMAFANAMTAVSLAVERLYAELNHGESWQRARTTAFQAAMIPVVNSLFAVGLVSLPGMMTGQILSGVSPSIAARYQIMVMCMIFAASGIATAIFLTLCKERKAKEATH
ncbi:MAG: ABC transporter permease [Halioglobus sp.]